MFEIREYVESGKSPFAEWFDSLDAVTAARVDKYVRASKREISERPKRS